MKNLDQSTKCKKCAKHDLTELKPFEPNWKLLLPVQPMMYIPNQLIGAPVDTQVKDIWQWNVTCNSKGDSGMHNGGKPEGDHLLGVQGGFQNLFAKKTYWVKYLWTAKSVCTTCWVFIEHCWRMWWSFAHCPTTPIIYHYYYYYYYYNFYYYM